MHQVALKLKKTRSGKYGCGAELRTSRSRAGASVSYPSGGRAGAGRQVPR